jgi:glucokinase
MTSPPHHLSSMLVMDIGGSHVTAAEVHLDGRSARVGRSRELPLDSRGGSEEILSTLEAAAAPLVSPNRTWTVAIPGPFDYERGRGKFEGIGKFGAIAGMDLHWSLASCLRTNPPQVHFLNDAAAYGIGEWAFGDISRPDRMLCITLGTGVGSAFLEGGEVITSGALVPQDGAAHRIRFDGNPLEESVSTSAIRRDYRATAHRDLSVEAICNAARSGDALAGATLDASMEMLGRALAPWIVRFGASSMVVGGAMSQAWDVLEAPLRAGLGEACPAHLRASALLDRAPLVGAAAWSERSASR